MREKKDSVSGNGNTFFSLHQPMKFLGHCRHTKFFEIQIVYELGVLCDCLFSHGVDGTVAHFFDIENVVNCIRLVEGSWDCIHRRCIECKVDDMVEGLA